jgi:uncharacterized protein YkwD
VPRPRAIAVALIACALLAPASAAATCEPQHDWGPNDPAFQKRVVELVNEHRASKGLAPLAVSRSLTRSAVWKSRHMAHFVYFEHNDPAPPVARNPHERAFTCGYPVASIGENIAYNQLSPESVMFGWLNSPGHRANIEHPSYRVIGVGSVGLRWTQNFGFEDDSGNAAPVANPDVIDAVEDVAVPVRIDPIANDADDDPGWAYVSAVVQPANGTAALAENGRALTYVPKPNFAGTESFAYTLTDLVGEQATGTVTVRVRNVNDAPAGAADKVELRRRTAAATIAAAANDTDVDGDRLKVDRIVKKPKHGSASVRKGRIVYRPRGGVVRKDKLTYRVSDGKGGTATTTVSISVKK